MTVRQWLYKVLTTSGHLRDLIGDRVYPGFKADKKPRPYVTFFRVSRGRVRSLSGDTGTQYPRFQIDVWADSQEDADAIEDGIEAALNDYSGTAEGITIQWSWVDDARDAFDDPVGGEETPLFRNSLDLMVWFNN